MKVCGREVGQHPLECAETDGALVKVLIRFGKLEANRVLHKIVHAPVFPLYAEVTGAACRRDKRQRSARVAGLPAEMLGDGGNVFHKSRDIAEGVMVDHLQDVPPAALGHDKIGHIDMSAAIRFAGNRLPIHAETVQNCKHFLIHFQRFSV